VSSRKDSIIKQMGESHWHETFDRQWELMHAIEEWMDVYLWEIDQETLHFANKRSKTILSLVYLIFKDHYNEIAKFVKKVKNDITVEDVIKWSEAKTS
jgi:hypothetical protein